MTTTADPDLRYTWPPTPPAIRPLTTEQSADVQRRYPNAPTTLTDCVTCHGAKEFRWWGHGREAVVIYECPCADQFILHRVLLHHGVHRSYQRLGWGDFHHLPQAAAEHAQDYLDHLDSYRDNGFGLVMHGDRGNGKTLLAHLVVKEMIAKGVDCYVTGFDEMVQNFTDGWNSRESARWFHDRVMNAQVLLVDDLGRERKRGTTQISEQMLESVVRYRLSQLWPTFLTTNLPLDRLDDAYGGHVASMLSERSIYCPFVGVDRRTEMGNRFRDEIQQGLVRPVMIG